MIGFLRHSLTLMARWPLLLVVLFVSILFQLAYYVGAPLTFKVIFDNGILAQNYAQLLVGVGLLFGTLISVTLGHLLQEYTMARLGPRSVNHLRQSMFHVIPTLDARVLVRDGENVVSDRFGKDVTEFETALVRAVPNVLAYLIAAVVCLVLLFVINWKLALAAVAAMTLIFLAPIPFARRSPDANQRYSSATAAVNSYAQESVLAALPIRLFALRKHRQSAFAERLSVAEQQGFASHFFAGMVGRSAFVGVGLTQVLVIGLGGYLAYRGDITPGSLVAFVGLLLSIGDSVNQVTTSLPIITNGGAAVGRINDLIAEFNGHRPREMVSLPTDADGLAVQDVTFGYNQSEPLLKGITLTVPAGSSAALVGPSGCGKSTLLSLIAGLHSPSSGKVEIGGIEISTLEEASLRRQMAVVPQSSPVFAGTVRENINLGRDGIGEQEVIAAAKAALTDEFVSDLSDGYDTILPSGDGNLSGGQRQRLSIARALAGNAPILLLDEATSALDPVTEAAVNKEIGAFCKDRTTVAVTHRLAAVQDFDTIYVLSNGNIAESGSHEALLAADGLYARMWGTQSGFDVDEIGDATITPDRLRAIPFFESCDDETIAQVATTFASEHFAQGRTVIQAGDVGDKFYVVVRGLLDVFPSETGDTDPVYTLSEGEFFGEIALVESRTRTASVVARTNALCLTLPRQPFLHLIEHDPEMKDRVQSAIKDRLKALQSA